RINMYIENYIDNFTDRGKNVFGKRVVEYAGRKGANQSIATAKQVKDVALIGSVGTDRYGDMLLEGLEHYEVNISFMQQLPNVDSGKTSIIVEESAENTIIYIEGANKLLDKQHVQKSIKQDRKSTRL